MSYKANTRFSRSSVAAEKQDDGDDVESTSRHQGIMDLSRHSSRYSRSALKPKDTTNPYTVPFMHQLSLVLFLLQLGLIFLFIFGAKFSAAQTYSPDEYVIYRDIMAMLLVGFGYLMTFLRKYGLGAVGFTLLLTALGMQLSVFMELFVRFMYGSDHHSDFPLSLTMMTFIDAEFFAAALLISYGAVIGRVTPVCLVGITVSECFFYSINKVMVVLGQLEAEDVGGTLTIHLFGAYFGLSLSKALGPQDLSTATNADSRRFSDLMSLIGTAILWIYWPSFVGATETADPISEQKCVINTILALLGSTVATFAVSLYLGKGKFDAVHIANSTLAGGVAVGSSARLDMGGGAVLLGALAGAISTCGYFYVSDWFDTKFEVSDTCGVHNLHGLPAVLGGLASAVFVAIDRDADFLAHNTAHQAWRQVAATVATVALASASGYLTGFVLKKTKNPDDWFPEYDDSVFWWEGEFYESVNTAEDLEQALRGDSTHHDLSESRNHVSSYKPRAPFPDVLPPAVEEAPLPVP